MSAGRTLLVGLGNPILGDDGIGIRLARDLAAEHEGTDGFEVLADCAVAGLDLVERLAGYERVILVDAFEAPDLPPGTLLHLDATALGPGATTSHVHGMDFAAALEVGRRVGLPLPAASEIHVLGIAARETDTFSETLSPDLEQAYTGLRSVVSSQVDALARPDPLAGAREVIGGRRSWRSACIEQVGCSESGEGRPWKSTG